MYGLDEMFNSIIFCEDKNDKVKIALAMNVKVMIDDKKEILDTFKNNIDLLYKIYLILYNHSYFLKDLI